MYGLGGVKMKNKKVTYHNNHLMYVNQDVIDIICKKTKWQRCKEIFTTFAIYGTIVLSFISLAYIVYTIKYVII